MCKLYQIKIISDFVLVTRSSKLQGNLVQSIKAVNILYFGILLTKQSDRRSEILLVRCNKYQFNEKNNLNIY